MLVNVLQRYLTDILLGLSHCSATRQQNPSLNSQSNKERKRIDEGNRDHYFDLLASNLYRGRFSFLSCAGSEQISLITSSSLFSACPSSTSSPPKTAAHNHSPSLISSGCTGHSRFRYLWLRWRSGGSGMCVRARSKLPIEWPTMGL